MELSPNVAKFPRFHLLIRHSTLIDLTANNISGGGNLYVTASLHTVIRQFRIVIYYNQLHNSSDRTNKTRICATTALYSTLWFKKNAPTSADYNYDPVQPILIIFSKLFVNDHRSCLVVKFSTSLHICCHYTL